MAREIARPVPDLRVVFAWLAAAVLIDATDGSLARRRDVSTRAPQILGRTIDDIVDYLTFTFLPLLLVWRMGLAGRGKLLARVAGGGGEPVRALRTFTPRRTLGSLGGFPPTGTSTRSTWASYTSDGAPWCRLSFWSASRSLRWHLSGSFTHPHPAAMAPGRARRRGRLARGHARDPPIISASAERARGVVARLPDVLHLAVVEACRSQTTYVTEDNVLAAFLS